MSHDDADLIRRLAEVDRRSPFDTDAFAARVIVEHSRRRSRRRVAVVCGVAAVMLATSVSSLFRIGTPEALVKDAYPGSNDVSISPESPEERTGVRTHLTWAESSKREQQMTRLLHRIETAKANVTANREEQRQHMLALYRAKCSSHIAVPDPGQLYCGVAGYSPTDPSTP